MATPSGCCGLVNYLQGNAQNKWKSEGMMALKLHFQMGEKGIICYSEDPEL